MLSLSKRVDHLLNTGITHTNRLQSRLNLDDPSVLGQAVLMIGLALLVTIFYRYYSFVLGSATSSIDTVGAERFIALQPGRARLDAQLYQVWLVFLIAGLATAIALSLRWTRPSRRRGACARVHDDGVLGSRRVSGRTEPNG